MQNEVDYINESLQMIDCELDKENLSVVKLQLLANKLFAIELKIGMLNVEKATQVTNTYKKVLAKYIMFVALVVSLYSMSILIDRLFFIPSLYSHAYTHFFVKGDMYDAICEQDNNILEELEFSENKCLDIKGRLEKRKEALAQVDINYLEENVKANKKVLTSEDYLSLINTVLVSLLDGSLPPEYLDNFDSRIKESVIKILKEDIDSENNDLTELLKETNEKLVEVDEKLIRKK